MTKATQAALTLFTLSSIYFGLLVGVIPTNDLIKSEIIPILPFWALVSFGSYSLANLGVGILTFKDKEDKYHELLKEIDIAKEDLRSKGVDVD